VRLHSAHDLARRRGRAEDDLEYLAVLRGEPAERRGGRPGLPDGFVDAVSRAADGRLEPCHPVLDQGVVERLLRVEVEVEGPDAHVRRTRDVRDRRGKALFGQHARSRGHQLCPRTLLATLESVARYRAN